MRLGDFKALVQARVRNRHLFMQNQKRGAMRSAAEPESTFFVHEEIVDSEPWMQHHPDDVIVVEQRNDHFESSMREQIQRARDAKQAADTKREATLRMIQESRSRGVVGGGDDEFAGDGGGGGGTMAI